MFGHEKGYLKIPILLSTLNPTTMNYLNCLFSVRQTLKCHLQGHHSIDRAKLAIALLIIPHQINPQAQGSNYGYASFHILRTERVIDGAFEFDINK
jgi:hypothetical protein